MKKISGILNVYFPFELKPDKNLKRIIKEYDKERNRQIKDLKNDHRPRTDMMDKNSLRREHRGTGTV